MESHKEVLYADIPLGHGIAVGSCGLSGAAARHAFIRCVVECERAGSIRYGLKV